MKFSRSAIVLLLAACFGLLFSGCGDLTAGDPSADGALFNRTYYYYYSETCRYDNFGAYDCGVVESVSPSIKMSLRVDSDGLANLYLDGDRYYYLEQEYTTGYASDYGGYYRFYEDDDVLDIYRNGELIAYWGSDGYVTYYYYDLPY